MSDTVNYAHLFGFESVAGAIIFAVAYIPLFGWFLRQSFGRPTYVFKVLTLFCAIRIAAFILRAVLAGSASAGQNISLLIADQVLSGVGFFGLLYAAYTLVLDRELLTRDGPSQNAVIRLIGNRRLFRLVLLTAVVLGIVAASESSETNPNAGSTLRKVSTSIFVVLVVLLGYQTVVLTKSELTSGYQHATGSLGEEYGAYVLCIIALLLLIREIFAVATVGNLAKQNNEHLWYPLSALPELIAVIFYATPGLVPPRSELPT